MRAHTERDAGRDNGLIGPELLRGLLLSNRRICASNPYRGN